LSFPRTEKKEKRREGERDKPLDVLRLDRRGEKGATGRTASLAARHASEKETVSKAGVAYVPAHDQKKKQGEGCRDSSFPSSSPIKDRRKKTDKEKKRKGRSLDK